MTTTINKLSGMLIASAILALSASHAVAADPLPSFKRNDKIMTKDELRACMKLKASNSARVLQLNLQNEQSKKERAELAGSADGSGALRAEAEKQLVIVKAADELVKASNALVTDWNARMAEYELNKKTMRNADRALQRLKNERSELKAKDDVLVADRAAKIAVYEAAVAAANGKISQRSSGNAEWNKKNEAMIAEEASLEEARDKYSEECASRRFKEDDEAAIKAGK